MNNHLILTCRDAIKLPHEILKMINKPHNFHNDKICHDFSNKKNIETLLATVESKLLKTATKPR